MRDRQIRLSPYFSSIMKPFLEGKRWKDFIVLNVAAILAADFIQCLRNLTEASNLDRFHQFFENIPARYSDLLQPIQCRTNLIFIPFLKLPQVPDLSFFLF